MRVAGAPGGRNRGQGEGTSARRGLLPATVLALAAAGALASASRAAASGELVELYRGTRQTAMGNAFTAVADDEGAIFMNPAGLAGIDGSALHYGVFDLQLSSETISSIGDTMTAFSDFSADSFNVIMGQDIYARAQITPSLVTRNLGVALIVDQQVGLSVENPAIPAVDFRFQTTNGIQAAYGFSVLGGRRRRATDDLRLGVGAKMLWRRGGLRRVPITQLLTANADTIGQLAGGFGSGWGLDLGLQYVRQVNRSFKLMAGAAFTDIGDIEFGDSGADPQRQNLSAGLAARFGLNLVDVTVSFDQRHLFNESDWRKRTHFGAEVDLPLVDVYAGLNQMRLTYGAAFDLWLFRFTAARYTEETAAFATQDPVGRWMLRIALKMPL